MNRQSPEAVFQEAVALQEKGDFRAAVERYNWLLAKAPREPQLLNLCACATFELGEPKKALALFKRAVKAKPDYVDAWNNLGLLRQQEGDLKGALTAYNEVRRLLPSAPVAHVNAANVHLLLKSYGQAREVYEQALQLAPDDVNILCALAKTLLYLDECKEALGLLDKALTLSPGHAGALSLQLVAFQELGMEDALKELNAFERLIDPGIIEPPAGYDSLADFNAALCEHCLNHPSLEYERAANATRKGHHSGNLSLDADPGPIGDLLDIVNARAKRYQETHPIDPSHPFLAQRPDKWTFDIWCVILGDLGYQDPHVHPSGWLSGVYYARLPGVILEEDESQQGWIEFGRFIDYPKSGTKPEVRLYRPEEGKMILFPSYMYHRTVPFHSDEKRISIAFDLIPAT